MTFDKLIWGGDYVANKTGMYPGHQNLTVTPDTPATTVATAGQDGSGDFFNAGMNPAFTADRGLAEWAGSKVYEHPGYPKMGTGSALGWIMSPALNFQALGLTEPQNIFVQFDYCRWDGEQDDIVVTAENAGSMPETQLVKDHPKRTWQSIVFKVTDATSETRIKISGTKAGSNRFFIDNFRVYVSQAVPVEVTSKLETPTNLSCTEQTPSSLSFTWKRDYDASSYTAELYRADNESVAVKSEVVSGNQCTFDELDPSADYKFRVMANCQPKPIPTTRPSSPAARSIRSPFLRRRYRFTRLRAVSWYSNGPATTPTRANSSSNWPKQPRATPSAPSSARNLSKDKAFMPTTPTTASSSATCRQTRPTTAG